MKYLSRSISRGENALCLRAHCARWNGFRGNSDGDRRFIEQSWSTRRSLKIARDLTSGLARAVRDPRVTRPGLSPLIVSDSYIGTCDADAGKMRQDRGWAKPATMIDRGSRLREEIAFDIRWGGRPLVRSPDSAESKTDIKNTRTGSRGSPFFCARQCARDKETARVCTCVYMHVCLYDIRYTIRYTIYLGRYERHFIVSRARIHGALPLPAALSVVISSVNQCVSRLPYISSAGGSVRRAVHRHRKPANKGEITHTRARAYHVMLLVSI